MSRTGKMFFYLIVMLIFGFPTLAYCDTDPLPSWNDGPIKKAIINFVRTTTDKTNANYVSPEKRIATFDNDGTMWVEQPIYTQVVFAMDRVTEMAPQHPEWKTTPPFKALIDHDKDAMAKFTMQDLIKIMLATHTGMTVQAFNDEVQQWLKNAKNPRWHRPYTELVYQPMLEVMHYLRANGFKIYLVSGGGQDFMRAYVEKDYGVPPENVIGSTLQTEFTYDDQHKPVLMRIAKPLLNDDFAGKPQDIYLFTGRAPIIAFGNSTGDQQMLEYTQSHPGPHMMVLVHHDDAAREYSYGPNSKVGTFPEALMDEATKNNWYVVSMKNDWKKVFAFDASPARN